MKEPSAAFRVTVPPFDIVQHRVPKMAMHIFRSYPSRAQAYIAETLEEEGWFDDFRVAGRPVDVVVGREAKYHASPDHTK